MWLLYIFIGIVISTAAYLILLFLQGAKKQDEQNNHAEMYRMLKKFWKRDNIFFDEYDVYVLNEYEQRFLI